MGGELAGFVHSCPKFVAMTQEERKKSCLSANICWTCLSSVVTFSPTHHNNCKKRKEIKVEARMSSIANGEKQPVRCHYMDRVTATFLKYDTTKAVAHVNEDAPDNAELQDCRVPPEIGGMWIA